MKNIIYITIGICIAVTAFHVWYLYQLNTRVSQLEIFSSQVAQIINNSTKQTPKE